MFCPECEAEYREGFYECADCGVKLVDSLPVIDHGEKTVSVFRTADATLLPVVESVLRARGIPFSVQGEETSGGLFPLGPAGGAADKRYLGAVLRVPESQAEEAKALLESVVPLDEEMEPADGGSGEEG
jgi:hypothetical protein